MYTSYRRDQADDWDGVIKITKKNLTVEEININKECKMVEVKVETYQKPMKFASCDRPRKNKGLQRNKAANQHDEKK